MSLVMHQQEVLDTVNVSLQAWIAFLAHSGQSICTLGGYLPHCMSSFFTYQSHEPVIREP